MVATTSSGAPTWPTLHSVVTLHSPRRSRAQFLKLMKVEIGTPIRTSCVTFSFAPAVRWSQAAMAPRGSVVANCTTAKSPDLAACGRLGQLSDGAARLEGGAVRVRQNATPAAGSLRTIRLIETAGPRSAGPIPTRYHLVVAELLPAHRALCSNIKRTRVWVSANRRTAIGFARKRELDQVLAPDAWRLTGSVCSAFVRSTMSTKKPDVLRSPPDPMTCLTLGEMHQARWTMVAKCRTCGLAMKTNLAALIRLHGPDTMWWGHQTACPGLECSGGVLNYSVQSIRGGSWVRMDQKPAEQYIASWKAKRGQFYPGPR